MQRVTPAQGGFVDALIFEVERQRYAVRVADVVGIVRAVAIVSLPNAPPVVLGIIDLRGALVPVLDLRLRFGLPRRPVTPDEHFVVLRVHGRIVAFRVDRAQGLHTLQAEQVQPMENIVPSAECVQGLVTTPDGILLVADPHAFLTQAESLTISELLACRTAQAVAA